MRNGLFSWFNFFCLIFVAHSHLLCDPNSYGVRRIDRLVIPLFSIMAGFSWGTFLKKSKGVGFQYGLKMFWQPYLFWTVVYFVLNFVVCDVFLRHNGFSVSFSDGVFMLLTGYTAIQLWFLITLVYVAVFYALIFKRVSGRGFTLVTVVVLALSIIMPQTALLNMEGRYIEYLRVWLCWMLPSFSIGILFSLPKSKSFTTIKHRQYLIPMLLLVGITVLFTCGFRGFELPMAASLMLLALAYPSIYAPKWLTATAPYIMGIYLVHALFTSAVNVALGLGPDHLLPSYFAWPTAIAIFFASWFAVWVMRKIPVVRNLV